MAKHLLAFALLAIVTFASFFEASQVTAEEPRWLHGPPGGISVTRCPDPGQWLLLYWGGVRDEIGDTAESCASADRFWMRRATTWYGFYPKAPAASDNWLVDFGEASFVHGTAPRGGASSIVEQTAVDGPSISGPANLGTSDSSVTGSGVFSAGTRTQTATPAPTQTRTATPSPTPTTLVASARATETPTPTVSPSPVVVRPTLTPTPTATPAQATAQLAGGPYAVTKSSDYRTSFGTYHIVGEVKNGSGSTIEQLRVRATAYDRSNNVVAAGDALACIGAVPAGGETPFDIPLFEATVDVVRYSVEVDGRATSNQAPSGLDVGNVAVNQSPSGLYRVSGDVRNNSRATYKFVQVCAAFYDSMGNIVRVDSTFTNPPTLDSRDSGSFEVSQTAPNIDSYRIWTTGQP